ncbi:hypothetical protein [Halomonas sp. ISL-104]|uniref:hypothetical protein n=1 Tax=Halomonas sp. ISL-104 TaxID=2819146 RepID=UPI001BE98008|nr:hypothetical protein [Halomonas sp. ISL-104]MBT2799712.1 hypothetical protein [Halomonas sp. ISL-104]
MNKIKKSFYMTELYKKKLNSIKNENNASTNSEVIKILIDYYIQGRNERRMAEENAKENRFDIDEEIKSMSESLQYLKRKISGIDFNTLIALHMLSDISDSDQVMERYMVPLDQTVNRHYERAKNNARHYLANRREL